MQELDAVGIRQLNLTGWQRSTFVENPHLKRLSLSRPLGSNAKLGRRLEAKARVVMGIAINDYESFAICLRQLKRGADDCRTGPFSLMLGQYSSGRKHESRLSTHSAPVDERVRSGHRLEFRIWDRCGHAKHRVTWNPADRILSQRVHEISFGVGLESSLEIGRAHV